MLRMASRIMTERRVEFRGIGNATDSTLTQFYKTLKANVAVSTCILADNVQQYIDDSAKETLDNMKDFPGCVPLCDELFIEWSCLSPFGAVGQYGCLVTRDAVPETHRTGFYEGVENIARLHVWMWFDGRLFVFAEHVVLRYRKDWSLLQLGAMSSVDSDAESECAQLLNCMTSVPMLAMSFANCKNVLRRDVTDSVGPSAKWIRRQKAPTIRYHVLDINPMKEVLRTEGGIEANGLKKALHICRGHFATYTEEKPLFGHITGTFWKPSHVRGSVEHGIVDKDYRIKGAK